MPNEFRQPANPGNENPSQLHTKSFEEVCRRERDEIRKRRERAKLSDSSNEDRSSPPSDLIGLALSGGGIRAASVGLGALQALHKAEVLKQVDYLSTVSGGGYIGGYLSSAAVSTSTTLDDALALNEHDKSRGEVGQPKLVQRLIFGGKYLYRPWEAANKYLIGLLFNNLLLFSGLVSLAALVALVWRMFDYSVVRDFLEVFGLNSGVITAYFPFYICLTCWIIAWLFSYFKYSAEAPGIWAQRWLYCTLAAFAIGTTILLVNPETRLGDYLSVLTGESKLQNNNTIIKWLVGIIAAGLTPLLAGGRLLRMGLNPRSVWEKAVFKIALGSLLVGVPLLLVGTIGRPNISGSARDDDGNLRSGDIRSWPAFAGAIKNALDGLPSEKNAATDEWKNAGTVYPVLRPYLDPPANTNGHVAISTELKDLTDSISRVNTCEEQLAVYSGRFDKLPFLLGWFTVNNNPLRTYNSENYALNKQKAKFCENLSKSVLSSPLLPLALMNAPVPPLSLNDSQAKAIVATDATAYASPFEKIRQYLKQRDLPAAKDSEFAEALSDAELAYRSNIWPTDVARDFNLALLRAMFPESFFLEGKAYRQLVIVDDQVTRSWILLCSATIFALAAVLINLNSSSLHRFYRNRIRQAYLVPQKEARNNVDLSSLSTTHEGAPYHLINATIKLTKPQYLDEVDVESGNLEAERRDVQSFLFSQLFCGSQTTGWTRTEHYETYRDDNINLADAVALSGSAVDAFYANSVGMSAAVSVLNLGLGQWMPNPGRQKPTTKPNLLVIARDWFRAKTEDKSYCYVSDGGFADNLGIMALLRRRCRLIIALDASHDARGDYSDLNRVIRDARIRYGVELLQTASKSASCDGLNTGCLEPDDEGLCERHFALARIKYPTSSSEEAAGIAAEGWLIYLKPSFTGDEGSDLLKYRLESPDFPNDSTTNQFYEPARVESYRQLGFHIADDLCRKLKTHPAGNLCESVVGLEQFLQKQEQRDDSDAEFIRTLPQTAVQIGTGALECLRGTVAAWEKVAENSDVELQTGKKCSKLKAGLYRPSCGHRAKAIAPGDLFPKCSTCRKAVTWTRT